MIKTINNAIKADTGLSVQTFLKEKELSSIELYIKKIEFSDRSPLTIGKYAQNLRAYGEWLGGEPVSEKSTEAFLHFLRQQGFSWSTVRSYYHALKPFLADIGIKLIIKYRKHEHLPPYYKPEQVKAILSVAQNRIDKWGKLSNRDSLIILTFAYTGLRRGELLALTVRDLNFYNQTIRVKGKESGGGGKGDKERVIPMDECLYKKLQKYTEKMKVTDRIFPIGESRIDAIIRNYARKAGVSDFTCHSFRHYFATHLIESKVNPVTGIREPGIELETVRQILGHANIATTVLYIGTTGQGQKDALKHLPNLMEAEK